MINLIIQMSKNDEETKAKLAVPCINILNSFSNKGADKVKNINSWGLFDIKVYQLSMIVGEKPSDREIELGDICESDDFSSMLVKSFSQDI